MDSAVSAVLWPLSDIWCSKVSTYIFLIKLKFRPKLEDVALRDSINEENKHKAIKMRGLPWKVTPEEIVEFFKNGDINIKQDDVVIERMDGKVTGYGLAFLANSEEVETAIESLNREHIGSRFILLSAVN